MFRIPVPCHHRKTRKRQGQTELIMIDSLAAWVDREKAKSLISATNDSGFGKDTIVKSMGTKSQRRNGKFPTVGSR